ncbi:acetamidase/formamidase family protein [Isachenkonia alkalipeptolytica]|uniref:Acetamidase n=1 Tax=Isachenkonia alkalipeptolytica TaxID=2565777 RepID=A0AA43XIP7_9CLOT|nr:acetamidase/formamidase family protein [Isachenkonia alkalipeptolytica]NBG87292.1 acetamidase [Isachenkonia alkalipeptolytica]
MKKISKDQHVFMMDKEHPPVLKVKSGSVVTFETYDCFQNQITKEAQSMEALDWGHVNPATGPLFIEEAEPGDVLEINIQRIAVNSSGVLAAIPDAGLLGDQVKTSKFKILPIKGDKVLFDENIELPLEPMIGVIGVAPEGEGVPCGTPGAHGGNMDNKKIKEGATVFLPVHQKGALLSMGDLHGAMGDGEIMVSGVEVGGEVTVQVKVIKDHSINNPMVEDSEYFYTVASHRELLAAVKIATEDMQKLVMKELELSFNEAGMLLSAAGNAEICQVVDPLVTARFGFPKYLMKHLIFK